jgi:hypothetical protein
MKAHNLGLTLKRQTNSDSCDQPTAGQAVGMYGHATYSYKKGAFIYRVEGVIYELRGTGCSIRGTTPQLVGSRMRVILSLNGATVTWFAGGSFGLKFPELKPKPAGTD